MQIKKTLTNIARVGALALALGGCSQPTLKQNKDLTGDGIPDAIVKIKYGPQSGTWLFISKGDGTFLRTYQREWDGIKYFKTDDGAAYFYDGEFYKPSPKQK